MPMAAGAVETKYPRSNLKHDAVHGLDAGVPGEGERPQWSRAISDCLPIALLCPARMRFMRQARERFEQERVQRPRAMSPVPVRLHVAPQGVFWDSEICFVLTVSPLLALAAR